MGEYYDWVNIDKKEYISPYDFDYGSKYRETLHKDSIPTHALYTLLDNEWRNSRILWLGDECYIPDDSGISVLRDLFDQTVKYGCPGDALELYTDTYRNVSCYFKEAEKVIREEINTYGIDFSEPYKGLFTKKSRTFRYTVNHTKRLCYSLGETRVFYSNQVEADFADPLPILMGYGRVAEPGKWIGDIIGVSDSIPDGYTLLDKIIMDID